MKAIIMSSIVAFTVPFLFLGYLLVNDIKKTGKTTKTVVCVDIITGTLQARAVEKYWVENGYLNFVANGTKTMTNLPCQVEEK